MLKLASFVALAMSVSLAQAGKRGLAWPWFNAPLDPGVLNNGDGEVVAIYDWETYAPPTSTGGTGGLGFIGMQGCIDCSSSPLSELKARASAQGWATVFSANEPDLPSSAAYMTPSAAATWYINNINPLAIKKALPAVTSSATSGEGLSWLQQMISACAGNCYYDYINLVSHSYFEIPGGCPMERERSFTLLRVERHRPRVTASLPLRLASSPLSSCADPLQHWYGTSYADFQSHVQQAHSLFPDKQIVITEFALTNPAGGATDQAAFFKQAFSWLDGQSYVELYFPFVATSPSLLQANDGGAVTNVGTGSCLYTNAGGPSTVGNLMY
ncbi:glycoside hydrolase family 128 protein [Peniophora sp. CONT]|nr:glycoside hydrolase family 128 protein [Peniophora sp. CONT]